MKRLLLLIAALIMGFGVKAQHTISNFTIEDIYGNDPTLYELNNEGKYVFIFMFYEDAMMSQTHANTLNWAYNALGCNMHDAFIAAACPDMSPAELYQLEQQYNILFPLCGNDAGGYVEEMEDKINFGQQPPFMVCIAPNHVMVEEDIWPLDDIMQVCSTYEIMPHACVPYIEHVPDGQNLYGQDIEFDEFQEEGKYLLLATCGYNVGWSLDYLHIYQEIYEAYGCNSKDLYVSLLAEYPGEELFHRIGDNVFDYAIIPSGGNSENIMDAIGWEFSIRLKLIGPDGALLEEDINHNVNTIAEVLASHGIEQSNCHVPNFVVNDVLGNTINLHEILDNGQHVVLWNEWDNSLNNDHIESLKQAYETMGCNMHDVFFLMVVYGHPEQFVNMYDIEFPVINSSDMPESFLHSYLPCSYLVAPDHSLVTEQFMEWPITNEQVIVDALARYDINPHTCTTQVTENSNNYRLFPNPANDHVLIEGENISDVIIYNALGQEIEHITSNSAQVIISTSALQNGIYFARVNNDETIRFSVNR